MYRSSGVLIWTVAVVMDVTTLFLPGNLPQGLYRIGLGVIVFAFGAKAIHGFLWGSAKDHWAAFAVICLFLFYSLILYMTSIHGISNFSKYIITIAFTTTPLWGLLILRGYRKSLKGKTKKDIFKA